MDDLPFELTKVLRNKFVARFPAPDTVFFAPAIQVSGELAQLYENMFFWDTSYGTICQRACQAGYIWHLFKLSSYLVSDDLCEPLRQTLAKLLTVILPNLLRYDKVREEAVNDFRKVFTPKQWNKISEGPLSNEWYHFRASLLECTAYRDLYERGIGKYPYLQSFFCDNVSVIFNKAHLSAAADCLL